jgi:LysR family transcriptional regulator, transcriptional activator of nhaA
LNLHSWFEIVNISWLIINEFDDPRISDIFGKADYGIFCAPTIIEQYIIEQFGVKLIKSSKGSTKYYYLITHERKVKHPTVQHLLEEGDTA